MKDLQQGIKILTDTIEYSRRHRDYDRVVNLAELYEKIFTGEGVDELLRQFAKREDEEMFKQRKEIYQSVMPAVANNLSNVFIKPIRSGRVYSSIDFDKQGKDKSLEEVNDRVTTFWQGESESGVDAYLRSRWFDLVKHDPNAFIAVEFSSFDPQKEKAKPYPIEYSSKEAINFNYINGAIDWLICETEILYKRNKLSNPDKPEYEYKKGSRFIMYMDDDAIVYTEVDKDQKLTDIANAKFIRIKERVFVEQYFQPKSGSVPAKRVGFKSDTKTSGRTCLSIFHAAVPFFKKELKAGSEFDLTMALHAFPQKIQ